mmetsp:Transcript_28715/g.34986  ORF Transcript_28715/g.34986 Transcript_28715/m.34986 type:complete len:113 (-) Transcript_28715:188-526(-)
MAKLKVSTSGNKINQQDTTTTTKASTTIDLESIPNQIGFAVLRVSDGSLVCPISGDITDADAVCLYRILLETGNLLAAKEDLVRVTISFKKFQYRFCLSNDGLVYIVKTGSL